MHQVSVFAVAEVSIKEQVYCTANTAVFKSLLHVVYVVHVLSEQEGLIACVSASIWGS